MAQDERKESILLDNSGAAWKQLISVKEGRVDLVLDNGRSAFTSLGVIYNDHQYQAGFEVPEFFCGQDIRSTTAI